MNERIKELAEQAELPLLDVDGNCKYGDTYFSKEKFAELIIKKCRDLVSITRDMAIEEEWNVDETMSTAMYNIEAYFGVEE